MKNVYDEIESFYHACAEEYPVIHQSLLEGYLRKKAWQGYEDADLRRLWEVLNWLSRYFIYADIDDLNDTMKQEYIEAVFWISEQNAGFDVSEDSVRHFFEVIQDFYGYLKAKRAVFDFTALNAAVNEFFPNGRFVVPHMQADFYDDCFQDMEMFTDETAQRLNLILEKLLNKIGAYYKGDEFTNDFNRAISLYSGPFNEIPQDEGEDFWMGFWDYFLFDYHLAKSDATPLKYFYKMQLNSLNSDEKHVLDDLSKAEFTLFYINRIVSPYAVECVNLLTEEKIQLPTPDYGMHDYKKVLLYGHIHSEGVVMLNYITSVSVSQNLRKRIKEEILRQHALYKIQNPEADLGSFFNRHAVIVRHTIDILVSLAKVNVVLPELAACRFPVINPVHVPDQSVTKLVKALAKRSNFSAHSVSLMLKMWKDLFNIAPKIDEDASRLAGGIFYVFSMVNGIKIVQKKKVASRLNIEDHELESCCEKIFNALQLRMFDPRYLTEEGFILSLYAF